MRTTPHTVRLRSNTENLEILFLILAIATFGAVMAVLMYQNRKKSCRTLAATRKPLLPIRNVIESTKNAEIPHKVFRIRKKDYQKKTEEQPDAFFPQPRDFIVQSPKKRKLSASTVTPAVLSSHPALTEIRFSDEYIYPSPENSRYQVYPLPGPPRSQPVAKVSINGHNTLIYNTQFGVLIARDLPDESLLTAHKRCLENGRVVFAKDVGLFKTHPSHDVRIYATHQMTNQEGLTLHLFDMTEQHAHHGK